MICSLCPYSSYTNKDFKMKIAKEIDKYRLISICMSKSELCPVTRAFIPMVWTSHWIKNNAKE